MRQAVKAKLQLLYDRARVSGIFVILISLWFLLWRLGKATTGLGPAEQTARLASRDFHSLIDNPLNAPQKLLQFIVDSIGGHSQLFLRLSTALLTLTFIVCFYLIARHLFAKPAAIFGTLFFLATPCLIVAGRQASAEALLLAPIGLAWLYMWLLLKHSRASWLGFCAGLAAAIYIPGLIWLLLPSLVMLKKSLKAAVSHLDRSWLWSGPLLAIILLGPLAYALAKDPQLVKAWLLIPPAFGTITDCLRNIGWAAASLAWQTKDHFSLTVGRWPMLDVLQLAISAFGIYALWDKARALLYALAAVIVLAVLGAGLNQSPAILLLALPAVGIIMTAGFRYLYLEWRTIFPRNPIPQAFSIILISGVVATQLIFTWRYTQAAWPNSPQTKNTYVLK